MALETPSNIVNRLQYEAGFDNRVFEEDITLGGLYTVYFSLKQTDMAAFFPSRVVDVASPMLTGSTIGFVTLDSDLRKPASKTLYCAIGGGRLSSDPELTLAPYTIDEGYFAGYNDGVSDELAAFDAQLVSA